MRKIILYIILVGILTNCTTTKKYYFHSIIEGRGNIQKDEKGWLIINNDSIDLKYSFFGENITMEVTVNNKTSSPLYIDWNRSWLKVNDQNKRSYNNLIGYVDFEPVTEIDANSEETYNLLNAAYFNFKQISRKKLQKQKMYVADQKLKTKSIRFNEEDSSLVLTSCIVANMDGRDIELMNDFYISTFTNGNKKAYKTFLKETSLRNDGFCVNYQVDKKEAKITNGMFAALLSITEFIIRAKLEEEDDY